MTTARLAEPLVLLDRDYPDLTCDTHRIRDNIRRGQQVLTDRIPARYHNATVTSENIADWVRTLVDLAVRARPELPVVTSGPSLLVLGGTGTGKTHQAYGAAAALNTSGASCRWIFSTAADVYASLRPRTGVDPEALFHSYATVPLLVLDDLGAAKPTEWTEEINYRLINHRYSHALPTLITSNVPPRELGKALGERVASRLTEMTQRVVLTGEDRRQSTAAPQAGLNGRQSDEQPQRGSSHPGRHSIVSTFDSSVLSNISSKYDFDPVADPEHVRNAIATLARHLGWRTDPKTQHPALAVDCPHCHAIAGRPCTRQIPAGHRRGEHVRISGPHPSRIELAAAAHR